MVSKIQTTKKKCLKKVWMHATHALLNVAIYRLKLSRMSNSLIYIRCIFQILYGHTNTDILHTLENTTLHYFSSYLMRQIDRDLPMLRDAVFHLGSRVFSSGWENEVKILEKRVNMRNFLVSQSSMLSQELFSRLLETVTIVTNTRKFKTPLTVLSIEISWYLIYVEDTFLLSLMIYSDTTL